MDNVFGHLLMATVAEILLLCVPSFLDCRINIFGHVVG